MKKAKRRFIKVVYRYRVITKSTHQKHSSNNKEETFPTSQLKNQDAQFSSQNTSKTSNALATFDNLCNPYQQFVNNLSFSLTSLPTEAFTGVMATTKPSLQETDEKLDSAIEDVTEAEAVNVHQNTVRSTIQEKNDALNDLEKEVLVSIACKTKTIAQQTSPNLRDLPGIPSCFLASKTRYNPIVDKKAEEK